MFGRLRYGSRGFTLIEILVALIIIAVGLLGIAGLQARAMQAELESYQRAQALVLMGDMVNRINANRDVPGCYAFTVNGTEYVGTGNGQAYTCNAWGTATDQAIFNADIVAWENLLRGASETIAQGAAINQVGAMTDARGCITSVVDPVTGATDLTVSVAWEGVGKLPAPADTCGQGLYVSEDRRRVVNTTVRVGVVN